MTRVWRTLLAAVLGATLVPGAAAASDGLGLRIDGETPAVIDWEELAHARVTLQPAPGDDPRSVTVACGNAETAERARLAVPVLGPDGDAWLVGLASTVPGMPYPIDAFTIESKPTAIISQQARRSVAFLPTAELRDRYRSVAAYMLQTAHHHYRTPFGDGALVCSVSVADATAAAVRIEFGRGLPSGPFPRSTVAVPSALWPSWGVDAEALPDEVARQVRAALAAPADPSAMTDARLAARRITDDGGAAGPWIAATLGLIGTRGTNPPRAARAVAAVSVAMAEALRVRRTLVEAGGQADAGLGEHAAAAAAAQAVLRELFPDDADTIDALAAGVAEAWPEDGAPGGAFWALGGWAGRQVAERLAGDGARAVWEGVDPAHPDGWRSAAPGSPPPVEPLAGTWRPWNLATGSDLRPPGPPRPGEPAFAAELQEVRELGVAADLDSQQIASFWEDKYGSFTPPGHWTALALRQVRADGWSSDQAALLFAILATAQADAFISAWDAKFAYWSVRPVTAIRDALDGTWSPYIPTPNFPSYVSGHATTSGAAAEVLAAWFPDAAPEVRACATEAARSRLLGGIHFRSDNEVGLQLGASVADVALGRLEMGALASGLPDATGAFDCAWQSALR